MNTRGTYNRFDVEKGRALAAAGLSANEIAAAMGLSRITVFDGLKRNRISYASARKSSASYATTRRPAIRKACVKHYGKLTASLLAERLGITRCSVIGHWDRAKRNGEIVRA